MLIVQPGDNEGAVEAAFLTVTGQDPQRTRHHVVAGDVALTHAHDRKGRFGS